MFNLSATTSVTVSVGQTNRIELPFFDIDKISHTFGEKVGNGCQGTIYRVKDSQPPRLYKSISMKNFKNGDEVRISKIAAEMGVAPAFHRAFVLQEGKDRRVVIEMDDAGKTMSDWMEELAEQKQAEEEQPLSEKDKHLQQMLKKLRAECDGSYVFTKKKEQIPLEEAINQLYESPDEFYYELFSIILKLAEKNISYPDSNPGNIVPHSDTEEGMQIIDFGDAVLNENPEVAIEKTILSDYTHRHLQRYLQLPKTSEESLELASKFFPHMTKTE